MSSSPCPALVLLPGLDGTGLMFEPFVRVLDGFEPQVVRYPAALTSYPDCVAFARTQLPVGRPFLLLGESFSGPVAIALAAERPPGLAGLVLCSTFARNPRPALAWTVPILRALPPTRLPLPLLRRLILGRWVSGPLINLVRTMLPQVPIATLKARLLAVMAVDHTALLGQIQVPILALCASDDRLVPRSATDWIRAHWPNLDIVTLQGPHWLLQTRPEACAQALQAFAERNGHTAL
jgi:pimeloyl-[acyl-carrier protein] methyl ester esterase